MRWKALAEIYTMHSFAPFSNIIFFCSNSLKILLMFCKMLQICQNFAEFLQNFDQYFSGFADFPKMLQFFKNWWKKRYGENSKVQGKKALFATQVVVGEGAAARGARLRRI